MVFACRQLPRRQSALGRRARASLIASFPARLSQIVCPVPWLTVVRRPFPVGIAVASTASLTTNALLSVVASVSAHRRPGVPASSHAHRPTRAKAHAALGMCARRTSSPTAAGRPATVARHKRVGSTFDRRLPETNAGANERPEGLRIRDLGASKPRGRGAVADERRAMR